MITKRDSSANGHNNNVIDESASSPSVVGQSGVRKAHISYPTRFDKSYYDYQRGQLSVTGTPKPPTTELDDLLISVKTTKGYHDTRLEMIIKTWYQLAKEQVGIRPRSLFFTFSFIC